MIDEYETRDSSFMAAGERRDPFRDLQSVVEGLGRPGHHRLISGGGVPGGNWPAGVLLSILSKEEAFKIHMDFTQWNVNARLVKNYIDRSAGTLDWLERSGSNHLPGSSSSHFEVAIDPS